MQRKSLTSATCPLRIKTSRILLMKSETSSRTHRPAPRSVKALVKRVHRSGKGQRSPVQFLVLNAPHVRARCRRPQSCPEMSF